MLVTFLFPLCVASFDAASGTWLVKFPAGTSLQQLTVCLESVYGKLAEKYEVEAKAVKKVEKRDKKMRKKKLTNLDLLDKVNQMKEEAEAEKEEEKEKGEGKQKEDKEKKMRTTSETSKEHDHEEKEIYVKKHKGTPGSPAHARELAARETKECDGVEKEEVVDNLVSKYGLTSEPMEGEQRRLSDQGLKMMCATMSSGFIQEQLAKIKKEKESTPAKIKEESDTQS
jgi:hypothetical protein